MIRCRNRNTVSGRTLLGIGAALLILAAGASAMAASEPPQWRPTYDLAMRWINFAILVFLLIKFGKGPLKNFLHSRKAELASHLQRLESEKAAAEQKVQEAMAALEESDARLEALYQRIVSEGQRERDAILQDAREHSRQMLVGARRRARTRIVEARAALRNEMVDMAMEKVLAFLPSQLTDQDDHRLADQFLSAISPQ